MSQLTIWHKNTGPDALVPILLQLVAMEIDTGNSRAARLNPDRAIRFLGITNKLGKPVAAKFRKGLPSLLNSEVFTCPV